MKNNLETFANKVQETAFRVSTGKIIDDPPVDNVDITVNPISILSLPRSPWAQSVDAIETPFADDYDVEEYGQNAALTLMGLFEMRTMLKAFGLSSQSQTDYVNRPLRDQNFFVAGCGTGREVINLASLGAKVIGIDATRRYTEITANKVARAENILRRSLDAQLFQCPIEDYPFKDKEFNGITSLFGVINHVEDWQGAIRQFRDALKPGGRLIIEKYGSNDALVFRLSRAGVLPYKPSILQRRDPKGKGILLGDSDEILPANFPNNREFTDTLTLNLWGFEVKRRVGFLRIAALFPREPGPQNISSFLEIVKRVDSRAAKYLTQFQTPQEILFAAFEYDLISQKRRWWNRLNIEDYAYVLYVAEKPMLPLRNNFSI